MNIDPDTIAETIAMFIIPFVKKGMEETVGHVGDSLTPKINKVWNIIKNKFEKNKDDKEDLEKFRKNPERYQAHFITILKDSMKNDQEFTNKISSLVKEIQSTAVSNIDGVETVEILGQDINTLEKGIASSNIKNSKAAKKITGQKINNLR